MHWIDIAIVAIVVISALISVMRGFVKEILSLVAWGAAFYLSFCYYEPVSRLITTTDDQSIRVVVALFILFAGTLISIGIVNYLITQLLKKTGLGGTDRLLGMVFGALRGFLIILVVISILQLMFHNDMMTYLKQGEWYTKSLLVPELTKLADNILRQFSLI